MILTTNRIAVFDPAIKSRIHLAIKYHALSTDTRLNLWRNFLKRAQKQTPFQDNDTMDERQSEPLWMDDEALQRFAAMELNGRQIKNAVRTAHALAASEQKPLSCEFVEKTAAAIRQFDLDIFDEKARVERNETTEVRGDERSSKRRRLL
jgi:AAA+ superfamily predicted ATPase